MPSDFYRTIKSTALLITTDDLHCHRRRVTNTTQVAPRSSACWWLGIYAICLGVLGIRKFYKYIRGNSSGAGVIAGYILYATLQNYSPGTTRARVS